MMSCMNPILEGYVKYRDGKKWKRRYCVLCSPSKSLSVLHLYFGKSIDDFNAAFRSAQNSSAFSNATLGSSSTSANATSTPNSINSGSSKPTVNVFHSLTTRSNYYCNLPHPQSHSGYVADPVTEMCNQAERAVVHDLEAAAARARGLGCPAPVDAITGFETGCHLSGESHVVLLIGWKTVHPIALSSVDEMFNWAEVLERALIDSNYHVTLCRVGNATDNISSSCVLGVGGGVGTGILASNAALGGGGGGIASASTATPAVIPNPNVIAASGTSAGVGATASASSSSSSRLQIGLQASLHVQQWRLCLIGEPSAGCQFIAQWRLDALDAAYTMESSSNGSGFAGLGGSTFDPAAGHNLLGFTPPGSQNAFSAFNASYQNDDRFFLEANRAAGKGLTGNYVFQVDGRRLGQLARAIEELMLRRFPALTAPPGTRVLPSANLEDDSLHFCQSAAIDIRSGGGTGKPSFGAPSSLSPPAGSGGGGGVGEGGGGSASPHGSGGTFAPSSLPTRGGAASTVPVTTSAAEEMHMVPQHSASSVSSSSRPKKPTHRQLFGGGAQTLGRSDAIKIPTRRFTTTLSKMTGDGGSSSRGRSSSKTGSAEGSAECSSSDNSSNKPQTPLYFPSVMVGAGIITSLVPAPPPPSQSARSEVFGTSTVVAGPAAPFRPKPKSELTPPLIAPPPPPPPLHSTHPTTLYGFVCERCQRRGLRGYQETPFADPASNSSEDGVSIGGNGGCLFAADEDVEQPAPPLATDSHHVSHSGGGLYYLYKQLYNTVKPFYVNRTHSRSRSLDICATRRRKLMRKRVFKALGGGEGSALDRLLLNVAPQLGTSVSCVFLLAFSPPSKVPSTDEMDYQWYLVHRPGNCCPRCCLWNTPTLLANLNLQDVVGHQIRLLSLEMEKKVVQPLRDIPCDVVPCLPTSGLFVWRFSGSPYPEMHHCSSHNKASLPRPWSVLYLGPDSEIDDGSLPVSPSALSTSPSCCCCYCGSPLAQPRERSSTQRRQLPQHQQNHHAYANLIRNTGSSTLPSICRRTHHPTAPVVFPEKPLSAARDVPDGHSRRGAFYTSSTSCSTSQASSPSSPQSHASYYNLSGGAGPTCLPPNPLKHSLYEDRPGGAYVNLQHLSAPLHVQPSRWRMSCGLRASAPTADQIPDEVREPKRNYALVDLRPSPASSVITPGDTITLVSTCEDAVSAVPDSCVGAGSGGGGGGYGAGGSGSGSRTDSSASTLQTNTSTSSATTIVLGGSGNRPRTASQHRRTSSHSLTAVLPVPTLNYVHIMTKRDAAAAAAGVGGCESPASSSTASSSTASSSEKEQRAPALLPPTARTTKTAAEQIPYAQIDFERTRALNAVNGAGETGHLHGHHHNHQKVTANAFATPSGVKTSIISGCGGLRSLNMRKKSDGL